MRPEDGSVWLAIGNDLWSFSSSGQQLRTVQAADRIGSLALDPVEGLLWVGTRQGAAAYDTVTGAPVRTIPFAGLTDLDAGPAGGIWMARKGGLRRHGPDGDLLLDLPSGNLLHVASTPGGGAWIATGKELMRIGPSGEAFLTLKPFEGRGEIVDLIADPGDGSAWVAIQDELVRVSPAGALSRPSSLRPPLHIRDLALYSDVVSPVISLVRPVDGSVTSEPEQLFEGTLSEPASLTLNGSPVAVDGQTFVHGHVPLQEGENAFHLIATDSAGNTGELALTVIRRTDVPDPLPPDPKDVASPIPRSPRTSRPTSSSSMPEPIRSRPGSSRARSSRNGPPWCGGG